MRFFYIPANEHHNGKALGWEKFDEGSLLVSFARCSKNDTWSKSKARMMCQGRLLKGKYIEIPTPEKGKLYETLLKVNEEHEQKVKEAYRKQSR